MLNINNQETGSSIHSRIYIYVYLLFIFSNFSRSCIKCLFAICVVFTIFGRLINHPVVCLNAIFHYLLMKSVCF